MPFSITSCFRGHHSTGPHISQPIQPKQPDAVATLEKTTFDKNAVLIKRISQYEYSFRDSSLGKRVSLVESEMKWLAKLNSVTGESKSTS